VTGSPQPVPFDFTLYRVAQELRIPPWELTKPLPPEEDAERMLWLERILGYRDVELQARNVRRG
jgi:hypothetical protein